ncbi:MAG: DUF2269 family protein [Jaaginema sp. PMC 1079.18]|nr:DUF2269 family protein [Jaaginema sp. PMC 1080.18]MEC4852728.1 DUF2269 family protein [Jaaginema sp. PMC 1079.18]MEC4865634.1 DUF2269 family protein [Jaaginema sp. PMC 1078.18]
MTSTTSKKPFKLNIKQKNWLVAAHVTFAGIWFGTGLCLVVMVLRNAHNPNGDGLYAVNEMAKFLDDFLIIPTATLSLLTGFFLSWLTNWGFVKHYWVMTKWFLTISLIVFGTFWLGPWINAVTSISEAERLQALANPLYVLDNRALIWGGIVQTFCLAIVIAISILKPWGRRLSNSKS